jgi:hypothetical protein
MRAQATAKGNRQLEFIPGKLRDDDVEVGRHIPPPHEAITALLERFAHAYAIEKAPRKSEAHGGRSQPPRADLDTPFFDGNGRVARLFTHADFMRIGLEGFGL